MGRHKQPRLDGPRPVEKRFFLLHSPPAALGCKHFGSPAAIGVGRKTGKTRKFHPDSFDI